ncbi:MAG: NTP transferase domain-containing protein [FCB group bacterium]|nr:NTP transferase domain-containing protein [FCB group bacterium]
MKSSLPKVMHRINGVPMVTKVVQLARKLGAVKTVVVVGHKYELIVEALEREAVEFAYQFEQKGTGHAVLQCEENFSDFSGNILVLSGDVPLLTVQTVQQLLMTHKKAGAAATVLTADFPDPQGYGRVIRSSQGFLSEIVEQKDATSDQLKIREINAGIYVFDSSTLFRLLPGVGNKNAQGEYYLPDVIPLILAENKTIAIEKTKNVTEIQGVNTVEQLEKLNENSQN